MPRLSLSSRCLRPTRAIVVPSRYLSSTRITFKAPEASQASTPGWKGRPTDDHAVNRDGNDVQSDSSQTAMKDKASGKEGSQAISGKDEGNYNQKAKETTKAPGPVIGMNDERGGKGH